MSVDIHDYDAAASYDPFGPQQALLRSMHQIVERIEQRSPDNLGDLGDQERENLGQDIEDAFQIMRRIAADESAPAPIKEAAHNAAKSLASRFKDTIFAEHIPEQTHEDPRVSVAANWLKDDLRAA